MLVRDRSLPSLGPNQCVALRYQSRPALHSNPLDLSVLPTEVEPPMPRVDRLRWAETTPIDSWLAWLELGSSIAHPAWLYVWELVWLALALAWIDPQPVQGLDPLLSDGLPDAGEHGPQLLLRCWLLPKHLIAHHRCAIQWHAPRSDWNRHGRARPGLAFLSVHACTF